MEQELYLCFIRCVKFSTFVGRLLYKISCSPKRYNFIITRCLKFKLSNLNYDINLC